MRSAQQQSDRRPPANVVRTSNNNYHYMNGSPRGPQPVPSNGLVNLFTLNLSSRRHRFFIYIT